MRKLGSSGLVSSVIGLGTAAFAGLYGPITKRQCLRVIEVALDKGITMLDTADIYARGGTERLLGEAIAGRRDHLLIATHGGVRTSANRSLARIDGSPAYLAQACDASLRRLKVDHIDLYYLSKVDPRIPVEESVRALADLVVAGKIRHIGLCRASADELRRAQATHPISAIALEYSLRNRSAEEGLLATAAELGVGVVAYCPLAQGLLAGAKTAGTAAEAAGLRAMADEAAELDIGMARLALAWLAGCQGVVPVPGTSSPAHLEMNASAADIRLRADTCSRMSGAFGS
jgi:aryl-alcohol dehydrogenase-like predicted oxidoreductase